MCMSSYLYYFPSSGQAIKRIVETRSSPDGSPAKLARRVASMAMKAMKAMKAKKAFTAMSAMKASKAMKRKAMKRKAMKAMKAKKTMKRRTTPTDDETADDPEVRFIRIDSEGLKLIWCEVPCHGPESKKGWQGLVSRRKRGWGEGGVHVYTCLCVHESARLRACTYIFIYTYIYIYMCVCVCF